MTILCSEERYSLWSQYENTVTSPDCDQVLKIPAIEFSKQSQSHLLKPIRAALKLVYCREAMFLNILVAVPCPPKVSYKSDGVHLRVFYEHTYLADFLAFQLQ